MFWIVLMRWSQKWFKKIKKKHHFDAFQNEKHFEKQPQLHSQTGPNGHSITIPVASPIHLRIKIKMIFIIFYINC